MESVGVVQPLALAPGDIDGHRELPLCHGGAELWAEGGVRPSPTPDNPDPCLLQDTPPRMGALVQCPRLPPDCKPRAEAGVHRACLVRDDKMRRAKNNLGGNRCGGVRAAENSQGQERLLGGHTPAGPGSG